jgi:hypothetical protein
MFWGPKTNPFPKADNSTESFKQIPELLAFAINEDDKRTEVVAVAVHPKASVPVTVKTVDDETGTIIESPTIFPGCHV